MQPFFSSCLKAMDLVVLRGHTQIEKGIRSFMFLVRYISSISMIWQQRPRDFRQLISQMRSIRKQITQKSVSPSLFSTRSDSRYLSAWEMMQKMSPSSVMLQMGQMTRLLMFWQSFRFSAISSLMLLSCSRLLESTVISYRSVELGSKKIALQPNRLNLVILQKCSYMPSCSLIRVFLRVLSMYFQLYLPAPKIRQQQNLMESDVGGEYKRQEESSETGLSDLYNKLRIKNYRMAYSATMSVELATLLFIIKQMQILALLVVDSTQNASFEGITSFGSFQTVVYIFVLKLPNVTETIQSYLSLGLFAANFVATLLLLIPCESKDLNRVFSKILTIANIVLPIPTVFLFVELIFNFQNEVMNYMNFSLNLVAVLLMLVNYTVYVNFHFAFSLKTISSNVLARFPNMWAKEFGWILLTLIYKVVLQFGFPNYFIVYLLLYLGLACYEAKKFAVELEYFDSKLNRNLGVLSLLNITMSIAILCSFLKIELFKNSLASFVCAFFIFFVNFFLTFRKFWIKRIIIDDNTTTEITQITYVTTFIIFSMNKSQKKNQAYVSSLLKNHCNNCNVVECCCKNRSIIYDPATNLSGKPKYQPHLDVVFVKHFYLKMIEDSIIEFPKSLDIKMLLALYHLEFLQLSPEFIKQIKFFNRKVVRDKLSLQQKFALFCLEEQFKAFVHKWNREKGDKHIERVKQFDELFKNLITRIIQVIENLAHFWKTLNGMESVPAKATSAINPSFLRLVSDKTLSIMQGILATYEKMKQLNSSSVHLREIMFFYSKEVLNDMDLFIKIKEDLKLESISRKQITEKHKSAVPLNIFGSRSANLVIRNINQIVWASNNANEIFGYKNSAILLKSPINNLMPTYFGSNHDNNVKSWLTTGKCHKMNKAKVIWCRKQNGVCFRAVIYLKVMTHFVSTEKDIHYYAAIENIGNNQIICGPDGEIYGCDEMFKNVIKCPIKILQNFRPNIQIFFPCLFQHFLSHFYQSTSSCKAKLQQRCSGYIPGKIVEYITNFAKDKQNFMQKNRKNGLFNQVYGMYLEVKMQEITMNLKGRYVTIDFEAEKVDLFGKPLVALKIMKIENDTVERYFNQFEKTIRQILAVKEKTENMKELTGAITKRIDENQKESPLSLFLNPKKLRKMQENQKEPLLRSNQFRNNTLQHRKQRAINQLAQIKNERVRRNINRMKLALLEHKTISPNTYRILTDPRDSDEMYVIEQEENEGTRHLELERTTMMKKSLSNKNILLEDQLSEKELGNGEEGSLNKFLQKDKDAVSYQQSTTSSAAFISLSTKIKLLKQKLWQIKAKRFLTTTNILFVLGLVTILAVSAYEQLIQQATREQHDMVQQQFATSFRLMESLMSSKLAVEYQKFEGGEIETPIIAHFEYLFKSLAIQQIEFNIENGQKIESQQIQPNYLQTNVTLSDGPYRTSLLDFVLQQYKELDRNGSKFSYQEYVQVVQSMEKIASARASKGFQFSAAVYLLSWLALVQLLALINVYLSQKKIRKVTQIISQLYPHEKLKHMRMFMKLSNKIVSILKIISVNECRTKDTSRQDSRTLKDRSLFHKREYAPVCIKIVLLFTLLYLAILGSYGALSLTDRQIKDKNYQCDKVAVGKLKLTSKLLAMHYIQLSRNADSAQVAASVRATPVDIVPVLIRLYNDASTHEVLKQVIKQYSSTNTCLIFSPQKWAQFADTGSDPRTATALAALAQFCQTANNGIFQSGFLNSLEYIDEEINYYIKLDPLQWPHPIISEVLHTSLLSSLLSMTLVHEFLMSKSEQLGMYFHLQLVLFGVLLVAMAAATLLWKHVHGEIARLGCMHNRCLLIIPFDLMIENPYVRQYLKEELEFKTNI